MITEKDFISIIQLYPELYHKDAILEEKNRNEVWERFAQENQLKSGVAAENKWRQLVSNYVSFLVYGTPFAYEREMQFMQLPLFGAGFTEDTPSDSEIDEVELSKILDSYEDSPPPIKRRRTEILEDKDESPNQHTSYECNGPKENERSIVTSSPTKQSCEVVNANTDALQSTATGKANDVLSKSTKIGEIINSALVEEANVDCVMISLPSMPSNNSCQETVVMPSSFPNFTSLDLIFLGYAKVLQQMPLRLQLKTKRKIADIMDEAEMEMFEVK